MNEFRIQGPALTSAAGSGTKRRGRGRGSEFACRALLLGTALAWALLHGAQARAQDALRAQLTALAADHGFVIKGLDKLGDAAAIDSTGALREQLNALLANYNHVLLGRPPAVERVIILGEKPKQAGIVEVSTIRRGAQHMVQATLEGEAGLRQSLPLMVDTGASSVVLPESMIEELGFDPDELEERESGTANGPVIAKVARLTGVRLGDALARDVEVLFIPDAALGETRLLGMSFFEHFGLTIDHDGSRLLLKPR